jgi:hypothetical protein
MSFDSLVPHERRRLSIGNPTIRVNLEGISIPTLLCHGYQAIPDHRNSDPPRHCDPDHKNPKRYLVRMRGRAFVLIGVVALAVAAVAGVLVLQSTSRPGGDPGNLVYGRLHLATRAIPSTATNVRTEGSRPTGWTTGCPEFGAASRSGWTRAYFSTTFDDAGVASSQVLGQMNAVLTQQGWTRHDEPTGSGRGTSPHWTLRPHGGREANLFLFPPSGPTEADWLMGVSWQPSGPIGTECP